MKVSTKVEGTVVIINAELNYKLDKDADGTASVEAKSVNEIKLNGLELADELLKEVKILDYIKEKFGIK